MDVFSQPKRQGITLIESIVALAIIGLLASIIMPAVQSSRVTARRFQCSSHLKQITLGVMNYESVHGVIPIYYGRRYGAYYELSGFFFSLFPFMGIENSRAARRIPLLTCPADSQVVAAPSGLSYVVNSGPTMMEGQWRKLNGIVRWPASAYGESDSVSFSDISDGLSSTACLSESLIAYVNPSAATDANPALRYSWQVIVPIAIPPGIATFEDYIRRCEGGPRDFYPGRLGGAHDWITDDGGPHILYSHAMQPNTPRCESAVGGIGYPIWPAMSAHPSGVNLSLMDGSCRFVNETIDRNVWRAMGTRDGGDRAE